MSKNLKPPAKERGILFSAPMVRALLAGVKTQTRRPVKPHPSDDAFCLVDHGDGWWPYRSEDGESPNVDNMEYPMNCPYGLVGERLWVRETWAPRVDNEMSAQRWTTGSQSGPKPDLHFAATPTPDQWISRWRPCIHMPRWASRILLEIVSVRVERLNDCSEADAKAEGVIQLDADDYQRPEVRTKEGWALCPTCAGTGLHDTLGPNGGVNCDVDCRDCDTHVKLYQHLWESINGAGSWAANPWVWVVEFKRA